jgi:hypothetical protein
MTPMPPLRSPSTTVKALSELGPRALILYGRYRLGLSSGYLRWRSPPYRDSAEDIEFRPLPFLSGSRREDLAAIVGEGMAGLLAEADEIANGRARLFGGEERPLVLEPAGPQEHWTRSALARASRDRRQSAPTSPEDVKLIWEAGRFGWALSLARAYRLTGDERHAQTFWRLVERFLDSNPPYFGPHWESAQEAAIRLISLVFAFQAFRESPESSGRRAAAIARAIGAHACRIPPTLVYARAQNNNHLLAEAAGLLTASAVLPGHPRAGNWRDLGWRWLGRGLQSQIAGDGGYIQQSANYHRLMLQIALWGAAVARSQGLELGTAPLERLAAATRWALSLLDPTSGRLPNLGPNDGGQLLPLASTPYNDHRPTLAAAALEFLGEFPFPPGPWDELGLWLGLQPGRPPVPSQGGTARPRSVLYNPDSASWAYLRIEEFASRPGHADLLHFDLWRGGLNLAQDAGTYLYNAPPPWDNSLARTGIHNTVTLDGQDQMTRAGRFLWLDWPHCGLLEETRAEEGRLRGCRAWHDGYRRLGAIHERRVEARPDGSWVVEDVLLPDGRAQSEVEHTTRLHWLLQDWPWTLEEEGGVYLLCLESPAGAIRLGLSIPDGESEARARLQLVRAGELISGEGPADPTQGWASLTYAQKHPALSFALLAEGRLPMRLRSEWRFED